MKDIIILSILLIISASAYSQTYKLLPKNSPIQWTGYGEIGNFSQSGSLKCKEGTIELTDGDITAGTIVFDMKSIEHIDSKLEKHLKAKDFFNVKKYPTATLKLNTVNGSKASGELSMHGISKPITINILTEYNDNRITVRANVSIDRTQYDIKYNSSSYFQDLGSYAIKNEFDIETTLHFATE